MCLGCKLHQGKQGRNQGNSSENSFPELAEAPCVVSVSLMAINLSLMLHLLIQIWGLGQTCHLVSKLLSREGVKISMSYHAFLKKNS